MATAAVADVIPARGAVACIPRRGYQALAGISGLVPRAAFRRIVGVVQALRYGA